MTITLDFTRGVLWWKREYQRTFQGDNLDWRDVETGERPGRVIEARLSAIAWRMRHDGPQPPKENE